MLIISLMHLLLEILHISIRLTIEILVLVGRLLAFMFREVIIPGSQAAADGLVALAGVAASRRSGQFQDHRRGGHVEDRRQVGAEY